MEAAEKERHQRKDAPHRHGYFTLIWCIDAIGTHMIDFENYALAADQLYIILPGQVHHIKPEGISKGWVVSFTQAFLDFNCVNSRLVDKLFLRRACTNHAALTVGDELRVSLNLYITEMSKIYSSKHLMRYEQLGALLKLVLLSCITHCVPPEQDYDVVSGGQVAIVQSFREAVMAHLRSLHKVGEYATLLGVSPGYLNEVVKESTGMAVKDYITAQLLIELKRMLVFTHLSIKEIAYYMGFNEPAHMSHFFKTHAHVSATDFRENHSIRM